MALHLDKKVKWLNCYRLYITVRIYNLITLMLSYVLIMPKTLLKFLTLRSPSSFFLIKVFKHPFSYLKII